MLPSAFRYDGFLLFPSLFYNSIAIGKITPLPIHSKYTKNHTRSSVSRLFFCDYSIDKTTPLNCGAILALAR
ncbi:hypothetical protein FUAX_12920 [Fulvitalea axinellae]|uniref:Uncharacterized protein n=1 Tax=Fulvitalea axinellae TaxID=1182444 RepID=A0AAU9DDA7_9BACT|nr:hypothetical protein FUAX_12920 [Fulvitalea axinellae]